MTLKNFIFFIIFTTMLNFLVDLFAVFLNLTHSPSEQKPHQLCALSPALGTCQVLRLLVELGTELCSILLA